MAMIVLTALIAISGMVALFISFLLLQVALGAFLVNFAELILKFKN